MRGDEDFQLWQLVAATRWHELKDIKSDTRQNTRQKKDETQRQQIKYQVINIVVGCQLPSLSHSIQRLYIHNNAKNISQYYYNAIIITNLTLPAFHSFRRSYFVRVSLNIYSSDFTRTTIISPILITKCDIFRGFSSISLCARAPFSLSLPFHCDNVNSNRYIVKLVAPLTTDKRSVNGMSSRALTAQINYGFRQN